MKKNAMIWIQATIKNSILLAALLLSQSYGTMQCSFGAIFKHGLIQGIATQAGKSLGFQFIEEIANTFKNHRGKIVFAALVTLAAWWCWSELSQDEDDDGDEAHAYVVINHYSRHREKQPIKKVHVSKDLTP